MLNLFIVSTTLFVGIEIYLSRNKHYKYRAFIKIISTLTGILSLTICFYFGLELYLKSIAQELAIETIERLEALKVKIGKASSVLSFLKIFDLIAAILLVLSISYFRVQKEYIFYKYRKIKRYILVATTSIWCLLFFSFYGGLTSRITSDHVIVIQAQINKNMEGLFKVHEQIQEEICWQFADAVEKEVDSKNKLWDNQKIEELLDEISEQEKNLKPLVDENFQKDEVTGVFLQYLRVKDQLKQFNYPSRTREILEKVEGKNLIRTHTVNKNYGEIFKRYSEKKIKILSSSMPNVKSRIPTNSLTREITKRAFRVGFNQALTKSFIEISKSTFSSPLLEAVSSIVSSIGSDKIADKTEKIFMTHLSNEKATKQVMGELSEEISETLKKIDDDIIKISKKYDKSMDSAESEAKKSLRKINSKTAMLINDFQVHKEWNTISQTEDRSTLRRFMNKYFGYKEYVNKVRNRMNEISQIDKERGWSEEQSGQFDYVCICYLVSNGIRTELWRRYVKSSMECHLLCR